VRDSDCTSSLATLAEVGIGLDSLLSDILRIGSQPGSSDPGPSTPVTSTLTTRPRWADISPDGDEVEDIYSRGWASIPAFPFLCAPDSADAALVHPVGMLECGFLNSADKIGFETDYDNFKNSADVIGDDTLQSTADVIGDETIENSADKIGNNSADKIGMDSADKIGKNSADKIGMNSAGKIGNNFADKIGMNSADKIGKNFAGKIGDETIKNSADKIGVVKNSADKIGNESFRNSADKIGGGTDIKPSDADRVWRFRHAALLLRSVRGFRMNVKCSKVHRHMESDGEVIIKLPSKKQQASVQQQQRQQLPQRQQQQQLPQQQQQQQPPPPPPPPPKPKLRQQQQRQQPQQQLQRQQPRPPTPPRPKQKQRQLQQLQQQQQQQPLDAAGFQEVQGCVADSLGATASQAVPHTYTPSNKPLVLIPLCRKGDRAGIERQIQAGANVHEADIEGNTPLHVSVQAPKNEIATVQTLLEAGAHINAVNYIGAAPLHYVCLRERNHRGIANILLENGAEVDRQTLAGKSPLHFACEKLVPELVEVFCLFAANVNLQDSEGNTPMHLAMSREGGRDTVKWQILDNLLQCQAEACVPNHQGHLPLHVACRVGAIRCAQLLIERQSNVQAVTFRQETCLHFACLGNHAELTQLILGTAPHCLDALDAEGNTPLHNCAMVGGFHSAALLLRASADVNIKNNQKRTPFDIAKVQGTDLTSCHNPELVQLLKDANKGGNCRQS